MKDRFSRFALRFLLTLLLGLAALLLHSVLPGPAQIFAPVRASPWELSKLLWWPGLAALLCTSRRSGGMAAALGAAAPYLTAGAAALCALLWAAFALDLPPEVYLAAWVAVSAAVMALCGTDRSVPGRPVWLVLLGAMALLYALFTFLPPAAGPFLDAADAAVMAVLPC